MEDLEHWQPRPAVEKLVLEGRYVRLEPLSAAQHGDDLYRVATDEDSAERHRYLYDTPPKSRQEYQAWLDAAEIDKSWLHFTVIDKRTGTVQGKQVFMRTAPEHGTTEIGSILWSRHISRTPVTTESVYLCATYVFDVLGYRRFEWKCNALNLPSRNAALRYGFQFEGIHRQALVVKGQNRDTAWFSMLDKEWPVCKQAFEAWLDPKNFDKEGMQKQKLAGIRQKITNP